MTLKNYLFLLLFCGLSLTVSAQNTENTKPTYEGKISSLEYVTSLASRPGDLVPADMTEKEAKDKRSLTNKITIGQDPQTEDDYFVRNRNPLEQSRMATPPSIVFDAYSSGSQPTDPSLAVGPNHVIVVFNTGFAIYDKLGNQLVGQTSPNPAIFPSGGCCDLTASYDNAADRWVLSFLGSGAQVAVSDGPDPVNDGWFIYTISAINDYQKLSIWSDGYYMTDNTGSNNKVWAMERDKMLAGDPNAQIIGFNLPGISTSGFYSPQAFNVTTADLPAAGGAPIVYMQDDAWGGVSNDHLKLWLIDVDWANTGNSTISNAQEIPVTPFIGVFDNGSFSNLTQPDNGPAVDALQATIMNQAQFRKYDNHNSAVFNFVIDTDASNGELAGIRWFELRQDGDNQPWSLYQEGTYTAPDGRHAWHGSMAMDGAGNIALGYTSMSGPTTPNTVRISSYFTGRTSGDPLGTMTTAEELIANGNANIPGTRYGDYGKVDVDPSDDATFWFINEYMNNGRKGVVGAFTIEPPIPDNEAPTDPTNLVASNITDTGATLTWTAATDNVAVTQYNIFIDGTQVGTSSSTTFNVTGLDPLTTYNAAVTAQDAAGNISAGSATTTFTTLDAPPPMYCESASSNVNDEFISRVELNTIDNASGAQFYSDFTSVSTDLVEGETYTITITPTWTGTIYDEGYAVWIDYNSDADFDDAGELVWSAPANTDTPNVGTFTVPAGTAQTATRMRVSMKYNDIPDQCESFTWGEVEDYTVNLMDDVVMLDCTEEAAYFFDAGWEGWIDGGSDCRRSANDAAFANSGTRCVRLRDDSPSSTVTSPSMTLGIAEQVKVSFTYITASMDDDTEGFKLEYSTDGGSNFAVAQEWKLTSDFENNVREFETVTISDVFTDNTVLRFVCDGSSNNDFVYIDDVVVERCGFAGGCTQFDYNEFDTSWGEWNDGGSDCRRSTQDAIYANSGNRCVRLRDGSSTSNMTTNDMDLALFNEINFSFTFITVGLETNEGLELEYSTDGGANFSSVKSWVLTDDFTNETRVFANASLTTTLSATTQFRLRATGSDNLDYIYVDDMEIEACGDASVNIALRDSHADVLKKFTNVTNANVRIHPNPAQSQINVDILEGSFDEILIFSSTGKILDKGVTGVNSFSIDVSEYVPGMYFVRFVSNGLAITKRFIKE